jgi:hypothetical protein
MKRITQLGGVRTAAVVIILSIVCWSCRSDVYDYREEIPVKPGMGTVTLSLPKGMYSITVTSYEGMDKKPVEKFLDAPSLSGLVTATISRMDGQVVHSGLLEKEVIFSLDDRMTPVSIECKLNKEGEPGRAYFLVVKSTF